MSRRAVAGSRVAAGGCVARWLALAANVGVVLVIVDVRQSAELTHAQMEQRKNDFLAEIECSLATSESAWSGAALSRPPD